MIYYIQYSNGIICSKSKVEMRLLLLFGLLCALEMNVIPNCKLYHFFSLSRFLNLLFARHLRTLCFFCLKLCHISLVMIKSCLGAWMRLHTGNNNLYLLSIISNGYSGILYPVVFGYFSLGIKELGDERDKKLCNWELLTPKKLCIKRFLGIDVNWHKINWLSFLICSYVKLVL